MNTTNIRMTTYEIPPETRESFIGAKDYGIECVDSFEKFVFDWMPKNFEI